jgi:WD40 repeat protein
MKEETLPPSPNWYLSKVLACTADGTIAYGSKNNIVIAKYLPGNSASRTPQISLIPDAHKERITVISFCTGRELSDSYRNCLASAGDDSVIRIWNLETLSPILAHTSHMVYNEHCYDISK